MSASAQTTKYASNGAVAGTPVITSKVISNPTLTVSPATFDLMRKNFLEYITLGVDYDLNDSKIKSIINSISSSATINWNNMVKTPITYLWSDYNLLKNDEIYTSKHVYYSYVRLHTMAQAYALKSSALYHNASLLSDIIIGLNFMHSYAYNATTVRIGNFWEWQMGVPDYYARIVSILFNELPAVTKTNYANTIEAQLKQTVISGNYTFGNHAWVCRFLLYCGVLSNNANLIQIALDNFIRAVEDTTTLAQRKTGQAAFEQLWKNQWDYHDYPTLNSQKNLKEGLYADGSFIQHIAIPYIGGYGAEIIETTAHCALIFKGTTISVPYNVKTSLSKWIDGAYLPAIYEGEMMFLFLGRNVTQNPHENARAMGLNIAQSVDLLDDATYARKIKSVCKRMFTNNSYYTDIYSGINPLVELPLAKALVGNVDIPVAGDVSFNKVYSSTDRIIHHRPSYRFGISMSSGRIGKFESINDANTTGWYTGDGMTYIYNADRGQYVNYFKNVNDYRLPGTTVDVITRSEIVNNYGLFGNPRNQKHWAGGVSLKNKYGVAGMDLVGEVSSLNAKKSWFMFDDEVVALGAGITMVELRAAETIVENRKGLRSLWVDGVLKSAIAGTSEVLTNPKWAHLDGTGGYYFPQPCTVYTARTTASFTEMYITHSVKPTNETYAYVLLPSATKAFLEQYATSPAITINSNTPNVQSVTHSNLKITGVNFFTAATTGILTSNTPASVIYQRSNDTIYMSISDPTQKLTSINLKVVGDYKLVSPTSGKVTFVNETARVSITFNVTDLLGQQLDLVLVDNSFTTKEEINLLNPTFIWNSENKFIQISNLPSTPSSIQIYNAVGMIVNQTYIYSNYDRISTVHLSNGVYIVKCSTYFGEEFVWKFSK